MSTGNLRLGIRRITCIGGLSCFSAVLTSLVLAGGALADTTPLSAPSVTQSASQTGQTPLEVLADQIASHIAGRTVSVNCESEAGWTQLVTQLGGDPSGESGFVTTSWDPTTGALVSISDVAELAPDICGPLQAFASAATKPTECAASAPPPASDSLDKRSTLRRASLASRARTVQTSVSTTPVQAVAPCASTSAAFWTAYSGYAIAILTLAHESIHLGGVVGGQLPGGLLVGDQQAEAKADCYGMQWMPYVAEQLGDNPADAQAIATYFWTTIYPLNKAAHAAYWSAECRAGGTLDQRASAHIAWP
jgi:hypothetical protein